MRKKRSRKRIALGILLITIIIVGLGGIYQYLNYTYGTYINSGISFESSGNTVQELKNIFTGDQWKSPINKMVDIKGEYTKAKAINNSTIGWIFINGTNINYPIMHGQDDEYYLTHNWKGDPYWNGSIFLDQKNSGFNNVSLINGHNMLNGIMFSQLTNFENKDFFYGDHDIYIYDGNSDKVNEYKAIVAIYCTPQIKLSLGDMSKANIASEVETLSNQSIYPKEQYNGNNVILLNTCESNGSGKHLLVVAEQIN